MSYESTLAELAEEDDRVIVMTAENRAAIRSLPASLGARFVDVGICEQTMIGMAAGLALRGRIPVVHALAAFLTMRAFEFIRTDVGIGRLPVKLVGGVPGFLSEANGPTHQAIEDISLMRGIPGMQVVCPADEEELLLALPKIVASPQPCYVRYNAQKPVVSHGLVNLRSLKPIDENVIVDAATSTGLVVTLEDHFVTGALYSITSEVLVRRGIRAVVAPLALEERWFRPGLLDDVLRHEGFSADKIADRVLQLVKRRRYVREGFE